jgi:hypothetical protein
MIQFWQFSMNNIWRFPPDANSFLLFPAHGYIFAFPIPVPVGAVFLHLAAMAEIVSHFEYYL